MALTSNKTIKKGLINLYWRKLLFFACLIVFATFLYFNLIPFKADISGIPIDADNTSSLLIILDVQENGSILVGDKRIPQRVARVEDFDEIRFPIIDNPGAYYNSVTVQLNLPKDVADQTTYEIKGIHGVDSTNSYVKDGRTIVYEAMGVSGTATLSIIADMPRGTVNPPLLYKGYLQVANIKSSAWVIIGLLLPILTCCYMLLFIAYLLRRQKVDIPTEEMDAPPMMLPPALVGALYHQNVSAREIAATLIDLALRGDIFILDRERDFAFAKNKLDNRLLSYEKILLSKIFQNNRSTNIVEIEKRINEHLYSKKISIVTSGIYILATRLGYFTVNPQKAHSKYQGIGIAGFFLGLIGILASLWIFSGPPYIILFWIGMMISAIVVFSFAKKIPIRTQIGQEALSNWYAFRNYLANPEKIAFSYENDDLFERYLPYAIALNCEVAWAKRFSEHNFIIPEWYISDRTGLGLQDFCLSLFPIVSYVSRSLAAAREPGFE